MLDLLRDLWWVWLIYAILGAVQHAADRRFAREAMHLHNAYRAELGQPPLWPDLECPDDICNHNTDIP